MHLKLILTFHYNAMRCHLYIGTLKPVEMACQRYETKCAKFPRYFSEFPNGSHTFPITVNIGGGELYSKLSSVSLLVIVCDIVPM